MKAVSWGSWGLVNYDVIRCSMAYVLDPFHVMFEGQVAKP